MKNLKLLSTTLATAMVLTLGLTGCSEDGDSAGSGTSIDFPSDSQQAEPTMENGKKVEEVVATDDVVGLPIPGGLKNANTNTTLVALKSVEIVRKQVQNNNESLLAYTQDVDTSSCAHGGTVKTTVSAGLTSTKGTYTSTYNQCNDGSNLLHGSVEYSVSLIDYAADDLDSMHVYFTTDFSMQDISANKTSNIKKGSNFTLKVIGDKLKLELSLQATHGSEYYGQDNAVYYMYDSGNISYIYQTKGRIYINNLDSYVDYDTSYDMSETPFAYNGSGQITSGEARYLMSGNGKVKIKVESQDNVITYIDADGDGTYEQSE